MKKLQQAFLLPGCLVLLSVQLGCRDRPRPAGAATVPLRAGSDPTSFVGWAPPEMTEGSEAFRWSVADSVILDFIYQPAKELDAFLLDLRCGSNGQREVALSLNGNDLGTAVYDELEPSVRSFVVDRRWLTSPAKNRLRIQIRGLIVGGPDPRLLGLKYHSLTVRPARLPAGLEFSRDAFFREGFSSAEDSWRWTDGPSSRLLYPLHRPRRDLDHRLELTAGTVEHREVEVSINGSRVGSLVFDSWEPVTRGLRLNGVLLQDGVNEVSLRFDQTFRGPHDPRRLGIAFRTAHLFELASGERQRLELRPDTRDVIPDDDP